LSDSRIQAVAGEPATRHSAGLKHHFADMDQQRHASALGMWLFLATEIMFFGGLFCSYLIYRYWYFNEFAAASRTLDIVWGTVNTAVLICSSLTVVMAVRAAQLGRRRQLIVFLILTLVLGLAFLGIKGLEWTTKFEEHHVPGYSFHFPTTMPDRPSVVLDPAHAQLFFSMYFGMTGLHALHMLIGIGIFTWLLIYSWQGRYTPEYHTPIEIGGLYWHFVDIIWIYLYPLLYLIDRHK
jgi:cytochrome c oxidase subunit 3